MNFNAAVYANGVGFLTEKFSISEQTARVGQMIFLICYAFGCELWAPWSEELGRWPILQASLALVNGSFCAHGTVNLAEPYSLANPCRTRAKLRDCDCGSSTRRSLFRRWISHTRDG